MAASAAPPMPPINPRDPFLSKLASAAAAAYPAGLELPASRDPDVPPYLDLFDSPKLMATPGQVGDEEALTFWM